MSHEKMMTSERVTPEQVHSAEIEAPKCELGRGDYTEERHQWLDQMTLDDIYTRIQEQRKENAE